LKDYADGLKIDSTNAQMLLGRSLIYRDNDELKLAEKDLELLALFHLQLFVHPSFVAISLEKET